MADREWHHGRSDRQVGAAFIESLVAVGNIILLSPSGKGQTIHANI